MNMKKPTTAPLSSRSPDHNDSMRRLQIGIAGVMAVLLLVGLAGLIGDRAREQVNSEAVAMDAADAGKTEKGSGAPLEELGVQAVTPTTEKATAPQAAKPAPLPSATAKVPDLEPDPALERARSKSAQ